MGTIGPDTETKTARSRSPRLSFPSQRQMAMMVENPMTSQTPMAIASSLGIDHHEQQARRESEGGEKPEQDYGEGVEELSDDSRSHWSSISSVMPTCLSQRPRNSSSSSAPP